MVCFQCCGAAELQQSNHEGEKTSTWPEEEAVVTVCDMVGIEVSHPGSDLGDLVTKDIRTKSSATMTTSERFRRPAAGILRGISVRESLRKGGNLWRLKPQHLSVPARETLFQRSEEVEYLDVFISHPWASRGWFKFLSLLVQSGYNYALACWFIGMLLAVALVRAALLPLPFSYAPGNVALLESAVFPIGPWMLILSAAGTILGLICSPYLPRCRARDRCFVDVACIHQADEVLMKEGIKAIGGFLSVSRELRILWSPVYLSRLWCVFELATYKKINPTGKVVLAPIFLETIATLFYFSVLCSATVFWAVRANALFAPGLVGAMLPYVVTVHSLRKSYRQKRQLFLAFASFDLDSVQCFSDEDRDFIHTTIVELYGSKEAFTHFVRGPLCQELLGPIARSPGLAKYGLLIISPAFALTAEAALSHWQGGAPTEVLLIYLISNVVVGQLLFVRSALSLLELLCDHFAETVLPKCPFVEYLQTFVILIVFLIYFMLGSFLNLAVYNSNQWAFVAGAFIGYGSLLIILIWLQRRSNALRLVSTTLAR